MGDEFQRNKRYVDSMTADNVDKSTRTQMSSTQAHHRGKGSNVAAYVKEHGRAGERYNEPTDRDYASSAAETRAARFKKGDEMEDIDKDKKGPESPGVKKPGKIPLSANRSAITEEPATRSSTHQNYKNTPDMNKAHEGKQWSQKPGQASVGNEIHRWRKEEKKKNEPIDKSDEVALKKAISDATTLFKAMSISLEKFK